MYLEADARMDTFQAQDGSNQTRLNLVQRKTSRACVPPLPIHWPDTPGQFEALSRPQNRNSESDRSAAEEPGSGLGAS